MTAKYEFYLTDENGRRLKLLRDLFFFTCTKAVSSLGTCNIGLPFLPFQEEFSIWFRPDWRLEVWRSPSTGIPLRLVDVYFLRKPNIYTRDQDNIMVIQFYGRNGIDLLNRRHVIQRSGTEWTSKTDFADDMMKEIVREQMLYGSVVDEDGTQDDTRAWPQGEFSVQADVSLGPSVTHEFQGDRVFDVLKDIKNITFQKNKDDPDNNSRIFFDVVPDQLSGGNTESASPLGWRFITKEGLFGQDRTGNIEFSLENENIDAPRYAKSHLDEVNSVYVQGAGYGDATIIQNVEATERVNASRWNRVENIISASSEMTSTGLQDRGEAELDKNKPREELPLVFLDTPGSATTPQSLYGIDWDLGDCVRVNYAGLQFKVEINVVYISVNENGEESITGRNEVQGA